jgi:hypothetical protein
MLLSISEGCDLKFRIVIPVFINGLMVTYHTLDVTGKQTPKYLGCPIEKSILALKSTVYNIDNVLNTVLIVEGPTDVWRMGSGSVCTWGLQFTAEQVNLLISKKLKRAFVMFDGEDIEDPHYEIKHAVALRKADELAWALKSGIQEVNVLEMSFGDPGSLSDEMATHLRKELGL